MKSETDFPNQEKSLQNAQKDFKYFIMYRCQKH